MKKILPDIAALHYHYIKPKIGNCSVVLFDEYSASTKRRVGAKELHDC